MNTNENILLLRSRKESWFLQSFQPLWCKMGATLQQVRVSLFLFFFCKNLTFFLSLSPCSDSFLVFLILLTWNCLSLCITLSIYNFINPTNFVFFVEQLPFNPIFLSFHSSAGEKVKKQLSSLPRSLSAQFYQLTRKPGVEEVVQKL